MRIELLYFDGCPSWKEGLDYLKTALEAESIQEEIHLVKVDDNAEAMRLKFLGSPSFQVDGIDLWLEERTNYAMSCRMYLTPTGLKGVPTVDMLSQRLHSLIHHP